MKFPDFTISFDMTLPEPLCIRQRTALCIGDTDALSVPNPDRARSALCSAALDERIAVGAFRHSRIQFMCADTDAVKTTIIFRHHIVLALGHGTFDVGIFLLVFHNSHSNPLQNGKADISRITKRHHTADTAHICHSD